jgi:hypothetical protein
MFEESYERLSYEPDVKSCFNGEGLQEESCRLRYR